MWHPSRAGGRSAVQRRTGAGSRCFGPQPIRPVTRSQSDHRARVLAGETGLHAEAKKADGLEFERMSHLGDCRFSRPVHSTAPQPVLQRAAEDPGSGPVRSRQSTRPWASGLEQRELPNPSRAGHHESRTRNVARWLVRFRPASAATSSNRRRLFPRVAKMLVVGSGTARN